MENLNPVERLLEATVKLRDRCLLMTAYAAGLRVSELVYVKLSDIDPERMMIRVEQGKGEEMGVRFCINTSTASRRIYT